MMGAGNSWGVAARSAAAAGGIMAAAVLLASSAASAAPVPQHQHPVGRNMRTLFASVRVFAAASRHSALNGTVHGAAKRVSVMCWTSGAYYKDTPIWYEISAPTAGYVSSFSLVAHFAPAVGLPHCLSPAFREGFNTLVARLRIRSAPSTSASITAHLGHLGSRVKLNCYVRGTAVLQDRIWYHVIAPRAGYVSGRLLNTGGDPAPGVPRC